MVNKKGTSNFWIWVVAIVFVIIVFGGITYWMVGDYTIGPTLLNNS